MWEQKAQVRFWPMGLSRGHLLVRGRVNGNDDIKLTAPEANAANEMDVNNPRKNTFSAKYSKDKVVRHGNHNDILDGHEDEDV